MAKNVRQQHPLALKRFPKYLKTMREDVAGMTQQQLAVAADMSVSGVSKYESKKADALPGWHSLNKMAKAMGLVGPARGEFFLAAGVEPTGTTITIDGIEVLKTEDEDDEEAPIMYGLSSLAA